MHPARRVGRSRSRKLNVDEHDVRIGLVDGCHGLARGADVADNLDVWLTIEGLSDSDAEKGSLLDDDKADGATGGGLVGRRLRGKGNLLRWERAAPAC